MFFGDVKIVGESMQMLKPVDLIEPVTSVDDNTLMLRIQNGCEDAFFELVSRYKHLMVNYLYRMLGDYEAAVDMAQDVFLRVHRNTHRYDTGLKFSTWIYRIATNLAIDEIRKRKRRSPTLLSAGAIPENYQIDQAEAFSPVSPHETDPEETYLQQEVGGKIMEAIHALPEDQRHIFLLKEMEHLQLEDISRITGVKIGTLKSRLYRARAFLQERLGGYLSGGQT